MRPDTAVVLAAGKGTRMRRDDLPKPLVPLAGRPMLDRVLDGLSVSGITRAVVVVGHLGEMVREHVGTSHAGISVDYAVQESLDGTAAALTCAGASIAPEVDVLLTWCDVFVAPAWYGMLADAWHARRGLEMLTTVVIGDPSRGASVEFDADLQMTGFAEKPPHVTHGWADGGVSILGPGARDVMATVTPSERGEKELATGIRTLLAQGRRVGVERYAGPWADLGTPEAVSLAEERFAELL